MRLLTMQIAFFGALGSPVWAAPQVSPPEIPPHVAYPLAEHVDAWPWTLGDVTLVVDRRGGVYLDGGDGDVRLLPAEDVEGVLHPTLREWPADRSLYLLADPDAEYGVVLNLLDLLHDAGVRVVVAMTRRTGQDPPLRTGMDFQLRTGGDTLLGTEGELPSDITTIAELSESDQAITLRILENGSYLIDHRDASFSRLPTRVRGIFEKRSPKILFLDAAGGRRFQDVVTSMDVAHGAGATVLVVRPSPPERARGSEVRRPALVVYDESTGEVTRVLPESAVDEMPSRVSCPAPQYPAKARRASLEGAVLLQFVVELDGTVRSETVEVLRAADKVFEAPAEAMIVGCRFRPGRVGASPVRVLVSMPIWFTLSRR